MASRTLTREQILPKQLLTNTVKGITASVVPSTEPRDLGLAPAHDRYVVVEYMVNYDGMPRRIVEVWPLKDVVESQATDTKTRQADLSC